MKQKDFRRCPQTASKKKDYPLIRMLENKLEKLLYTLIDKDAEYQEQNLGLIEDEHGQPLLFEWKPIPKSENIEVHLDKNLSSSAQTVLQAKMRLSADNLYLPTQNIQDERSFLKSMQALLWRLHSVNLLSLECLHYILKHISHSLSWSLNNSFLGKIIAKS